MPSFNLVRPPNLHSLAGSGQPLCVACRKCGHRAAVPHEKVDAFSGNMDEIRSLKLKCSKCEAKDFEAFVVHNAERVALFLEGQDLMFFRERPPTPAGGPTFR